MQNGQRVDREMCNIWINNDTILHRFWEMPVENVNVLFGSIIKIGRKISLSRKNNFSSISWL